MNQHALGQVAHVLLREPLGEADFLGVVGRRNKFGYRVLCVLTTANGAATAPVRSNRRRRRTRRQ